MPCWSVENFGAAAADKSRWASAACRGSRRRFVDKPFIPIIGREIRPANFAFDHRSSKLNVEHHFAIRLNPALWGRCPRGPPEQQRFSGQPPRFPGKTPGGRCSGRPPPVGSRDTVCPVPSSAMPFASVGKLYLLANSVAANPFWPPGPLCAALPHSAAPGALGACWNPNTPVTMLLNSSGGRFHRACR